MSNLNKIIPYEWKDEYVVNIKIIDAQHKMFIDICNQLIHAINEERCKEEMSSVFFALSHFALNHFANEEIYLSEFQYPEFKRHREFHKQFIETIADLQNKYKDGQEGVCLELVIYLKNWFHNHVRKYDKDVVEFLKEKGVE